MKLLNMTTSGLVAGATLLMAASPAEAQYRYRNRGGDRTALAIGAGVVGLALGAALTSNSRRDRYYDGRGYYGRPRGYAYNYGYGGGYGGNYGYGRPYGYQGYYGRAPRARCYTDRVWDDWRGRWRRVRVCN